MPPERPTLNRDQARCLRTTCRHIDGLLCDIEAVLNAAESGAAFPRYIPDITPAQRRTIEDSIVQIRKGLLRALDGVPGEAAAVPASRAVHTALVAAGIAAEELKPKYMRGYGDLEEGAAAGLNGVAGELHRLIAGLDRYVAREAGQDLKGRLQRLEGEGADLRLLSEIEEVVAECGLVEFRGAIASVLDRAEDRTFEIALFGRVSSGKSSLLNAILDTGALPVGVTPVTAVPIRVVYGDEPSFTVSYANAPASSYPLERLGEFASEEQNPENGKGVSGIAVTVPAPRLRGGVAFVDTPGLGSLATHGAAETLAYLPSCDLGIVLIDAGSTLTAGDVQTVLALAEAAVPVHLLLSKADLLSPEECGKMCRYLQEGIKRECGLDLPVHPVSTIASHRALLDRWFDGQILPLFGRTEELRAASVQRKIGGLRESVVSALRLEAGREGASRPEAGTVEARLRRASGLIEETRSACEREIDGIAGCLPEIAAGIASLVMDGGAAGEVRAAVSGPVQGRAEKVRAAVEGLARSLQDDLVSSACDLGLPDMPEEGELLSLIRGMPVFDPGAVGLQPSGPGYAALLGRQFAERRLAERIEREIRGTVGPSLDAYRAALFAWMEAVTGEIARRFETYAGSCLARCSPGGTGLTPDLVAAIERRLALPDRSAPGAGA